MGVEVGKENDSAETLCHVKTLFRLGKSLNFKCHMSFCILGRSNIGGSLYFFFNWVLGAHFPNSGPKF